MPETKVNLLHVITTLGVGGAEKHLITLINELPRDKYNVYVVYLKGGGELQSSLNDVEVTKISIVNIFLSLIAVFNLIKFIRSKKIDILHTHLLKADMIGAIAGRICGKKIIASKHNDEHSLQNSMIASIHGAVTNNFVDDVICISDHVTQYIESNHAE